jgi:hypothetical protein
MRRGIDLPIERGRRPLDVPAEAIVTAWWIQDEAARAVIDSSDSPRIV